MRLEQDPIHRHKDVLHHTIAVVAKTRPERLVRLAALLHDVGKPRTRAIGEGGVSFHHHEVVGARMARDRMRALKYSNEDVDAVSRLVYLHLRFHTYQMGWTDSAVRRFVRDAGPLLSELIELTRCDCTTRNERKAAHAERPHGRARSPDRRARGAGGAGRHPPRPRRRPGHGPPRHRARAGTWAGPWSSCSRPASRRAPWARTRPTAASTPGGWTSPEAASAPPGGLPQRASGQMPSLVARMMRVAGAQLMASRQ